MDLRFAHVACKVSHAHTARSTEKIVSYYMAPCAREGDGVHTAQKRGETCFLLLAHGAEGGKGNIFHRAKRGDKKYNSYPAQKGTKTHKT